MRAKGIALAIVVATIGPATAGFGVGTVVANPYAAMSVQGGTLAGDKISTLQSDAVIQLGPTPGAPGSAAEIDFQGVALDAGATLTVRAGAPGQAVVLRNVDASPTTIAGRLRTEAGPGAPAPVLYLSAPSGITVLPGASISSSNGLILDALGDTPQSGQSVVNEGTVNGGDTLWLYGASINGGGRYRGDDVHVSTFGNVNNPIHGMHFLDNGIQVHPATSTAVRLTLNAYGSTPQILNIEVTGDAVVSMPSTWPAGSALPRNNLPLTPGDTGDPPSYGGGSMIVQASGNLTLAPDVDDFVFPGGIVLKAGGVLDLSGVEIDNGWTSAGVTMQGVFLEAPKIVSSGGDIRVFTNFLNWVNFSTLPDAPLETFQLSGPLGGPYTHVAANDVAPHLNAYSTVTEAAANGQCWTCLVDSTPIGASSGGSKPPAVGAPGSWSKYATSYEAGNEAEYQSWYNITYDSRRDVFYGVSWMGQIAAFSPVAGRWTKLSPDIGGGVHNRVLTYDPLNDRVWLGDGTGAQLKGVNYFDPVTAKWISHPMTGRAPGLQSAMIYDPSGKRFIVFGGWNRLGVHTFALDPVATSLTDTRITGGPVYDNDARKMTAWRSDLDSKRQRIFYVDTDGALWFLPLSLTGWERVMPAGPTPPAYTQYVYDAANDAIVGWSASPRVAGGDTVTGNTRETWLLPFATMTWTRAASLAGGQTVPPDTVYVGYAMGYDPLRKQVILHSLASAGNYSPTTWAYRYPTGIIPPATPVPTASITATATASDSYRFTAAATAPPGLAIAAYAWDFGDGTGATGSPSTHTYTKSGTYSVALTVTDSNGATASTATSVTANVPVLAPPTPPPVTAPPPTPPPPPQGNVPTVTGKLTSFPLPALGKKAPFSADGSSKHTNMASDGKRLYVSGGDWTHSATDGTWSMSLADGSWRQDVGDPVYPTLPAPHALQDGAGFAWVPSRQQFLLWPGSYFAYDAADAPLRNYARGMWWFDPVTNTYTQDLSLFPTASSSTGSLNGGVFDEINGHIVEFADSTSGFAARRWDVKAQVRLPDIPFAVALTHPYGAYFTRTKHVKIGRDVYIVGYRTNGEVASQTPLLLRWNLDTQKMVELTPPPVDGTLIRDLEVRLATSRGKLVWPFMNGPEGDLRGLWIYDPATNAWAVDNQVPPYGNFIANSVTSLPDGRVAMSGGVFGKQQTHMWFYEAP